MVVYKFPYRTLRTLQSQPSDHLPAMKIACCFFFFCNNFACDKFDEIEGVFFCNNFACVNSISHVIILMK
ncbi:hypothetical protein Hanom_Chr11g01005351 [Helianthus anomalus]